MKGAIWCLHGAVGMADDWRDLTVPGWAVKRVDLWRFLDCCPMEMPEFGRALNEEAAATSGKRVLLGYSMGGRLALHALLAGGPWDAAVIVSAHPGLEVEDERVARRAADAEWAARALKGEWRGFLKDWNAQAVLGTPNIERSTSNAELTMGDRGRLEMRRQAVARSFMDWSLGTQQALSGRMEEITCPLLWVVGEGDGKFRGLAEGIPGVEPWVAPGAGHRVPWESADFAPRVGEFLERAVS